jgi:hypothetical protein
LACTVGQITGISSASQKFSSRARAGKPAAGFFNRTATRISGRTISKAAQASQSALPSEPLSAPPARANVPARGVVPIYARTRPLATIRDGLGRARRSHCPAQNILKIATRNGEKMHEASKLEVETNPDL